jgi:rRNA small subunit pseudouridine methyltransferase Nep1
LKLNLVIAEAALEAIPEGIRKHGAILADARRRGVQPSRILLDRSIHHAAMQRLPDEFKRGRPDLIHITLLNVFLEFEEKTRPPKSYARFRNLIEGALSERPNAGLIRAYDSTLPGLLKSLKADLVMGLSILGKPRSFEDTAAQVSMKKSPAVLIGGFPRGHFSTATVKAVDELARIDERPLDAHVVAARMIYEVEKALKDK